MSAITFTSNDPCVCCGHCIVIAHECRNRGGTATLCGHSEYTDPSTPPKKYRVKTLSGIAYGSGYSNSNCTAKTNENTNEFSGSSSYSASTCVVTNTGQRVLATQLGSTSGDGTFAATTIGDPYCGDTEILTPITRRFEHNGLCNPCSTFWFNRAPSTAIETLSVEDTEAAALTRLLAGAGGTWGSWIMTCPGSTGTCLPVVCCRAAYELRTTEFDFEYREAQWRSVVTGLLPGITYWVRVHFYRRLYNNGSYMQYGFYVMSQVADGAGNATFTGTVPNDYGYETYAHQVYLCTFNPLTRLEPNE